jgi:tRNA pseudouridine55 synthase
MTIRSSISGVINLNKPQGITSRDAVNQIQRLVRPLKAGHAGTLDPMATGVLLVCIGDATRLMTLLQERTKTYVTEFTLGQTSDTDDSTGKILQYPIPTQLPDHAAIADALKQLTGIVAQVPPAFSAVHVQGQRAYDLARKGTEFSLSSREVVVHSIEILSWQWPLLHLQITCGSGTYIRSIARDLGQLLGCGALMSRLERTAIGEFRIEDAVSPESLQQTSIHDAIIPATQIATHLPRYQCSEQDCVDLVCGRQLVVDQQRLSVTESLPAGTQIALADKLFQQLYAVAVMTENGTLQPKNVFLRQSASDADQTS